MITLDTHKSQLKEFLLPNSIFQIISNFQASSSTKSVFQVFLFRFNEKVYKRFDLPV